jgi:hypothetical protein
VIDPPLIVEIGTTPPLCAVASCYLEWHPVTGSGAGHLRNARLTGRYPRRLLIASTHHTPVTA